LRATVDFNVFGIQIDHEKVLGIQMTASGH
jgi:hypothetical protein